MSESCRGLKHFAFFEELARSDDGDATWRSTAAGLVVMRLVDEWIESEAAGRGLDAWSVAAAREALGDVPETTPLRRILMAIVDAASAATTVSVAELCPRLMAFGQALEYEARWALAADVYRTIVAHAHPVDDADLVVSAHIQLAFCLRNAGDLEESALMYGAAATVATAAGDLLGVLRARLGDAKTAIARGNMPQAEVILDATILKARQAGLSDVQSHALHERAHVAGLRQQYQPSIQFAYAALELAPSQRQKDRILNDIATSFMYLGLLDVARDGFLVLVATADEQYIRWLAELNLIEIAARHGDELQFDRYRRDLEDADFSPQLRVVYLLHVGRGYHTLGQPEVGVPYLERAVEIAEAYRYNQMLFEAEQALADARARIAVYGQARPAEVDSSTEDVIGFIHSMKRMATV